MVNVMERKKVMILGVCGFIGSNLAHRLCKEGYSVVGVDNLSGNSKENLTELWDIPTFKFIMGDICDYVPAYGDIPDIVFNLASPASPKLYIDNPFPTMLANGTGALKVIEWATKLNVMVIYTSTSEVYGDPEVSPQTEDLLGSLPLTSPRASYDYSKQFAEVAHYQAKRTLGLDTRVLRLFNTYGPRMGKDDGRVISSFIFGAKDDGVIEVHGSGKQERSFMYIDDLLDALCKCMEPDRGWDGALNLGKPFSTTIEDLATMVQGMYPEADICYGPMYPDDPTNREPDIHKARLLLDWFPMVELPEGLRLTNDWANK